MRLRSILSEAMRNVGAGNAHALALFVAVLLGGMLLGGYEAYTVVAMEHEAMARVQAMADVDTVVGGTVDGGACDRLAQSSGVPIAQSGAVRTGEEITPLSTPNNALQSFEVTQGMLSLIASNGAVASPIDTSGIWVSTDVARDFGLTVGSTLATDHGNATVAGVYPWPNDGRDTRFAYAFLVPRAASLGDYNECWIRQWPRSEPASNLLYATLRVGNGQNQAGVVALNKGFDAHYDPYATYMARATRLIPLLAAFLGIAIGVASVRVRRLEYAAALHSGESKPAQLLGICVETLVWAGLATVGSCALIAAYGARMAVGDTALAIATACRAPVALLCAGVLAALASGLCVRQSQLFRLFKRR